MGFWSDLKNAGPHKGVARGRELSAARIRSITPAPELRSQGVKKCEVCHATFGALFFKEAYPCVVSISPLDHLSFGDKPPNYIVCNKCVETFDLIRTQLLSEAEDEEYRSTTRAKEAETAQPPRPSKQKAGSTKGQEQRDRSGHKPDAMPSDPVAAGRCTTCNQRLNGLDPREARFVCPSCGAYWMNNRSK